MAKTKPMQLGLIFWAKEDPVLQLEQLREFGLWACQLGVPPELDCGRSVGSWRKDLAAQGVTLTGVACAYAGEDYSSRVAVHETVGFTSPKYRADRVMRTKEASDFAASLGAKMLSCHIGLIPEDPSEKLYQDLIAVAGSICDHCAKHGQDFALETGQESAKTLMAFIAHADRENLKVNFDPANMIMHGAGDPIEALRLLRPHVFSVHCKDGRSPAGEGMLGHECALGDGEVDFPAFLRQLKAMKYAGALTIEREVPDEEQRSRDIRLGIERLEGWMKSLS